MNLLKIRLLEIICSNLFGGFGVEVDLIQFVLVFNALDLTFVILYKNISVDLDLHGFQN